MDRDQFVRLMDGTDTDVQDWALEYEGAQRFIRAQESQGLGLDPTGLSESFSGTYSRRGDGSIRSEIYSMSHATGIAAHGLRVTSDSRMVTSTQISGRQEATVTVEDHSPARYWYTGSLGRLLLRDLLMERLRTANDFEYHGVHRIDDRDCPKVSFRERGIPPSPEAHPVEDFFWVDLERGGNVLRHEQRWGKDLATATVGVRLQEFQANSGRRIWLPVYGRVESHVAFDPTERRTYFPDEPIYVETYDVLEDSVRLEQGLKDEYFSIKAKPGDLVTDQVKKAQYEFGQYLVRSEAERARPVSDAEVRANLDRMLQDADVLARELKASSPTREGPSWTTYAPWAVSGLALAGLAVVYLRRRAA